MRKITAVRPRRSPGVLRPCLNLVATSVLVALSWVCSYFAIKHLPGSLASPVRATGPVWTLPGAMLVALAGGLHLFGEVCHRPKVFAAVGVLAGIVLTIPG